MKKLSRLILLTITPLLLTSCAKNAHAIFMPYSIEVMMYKDDVTKYPDYLFMNLDAQNVIDLCESEATFMLYIHSKDCSACADTDNNWQRYLKGNSLTIYGYHFGEDYTKLTSYNPGAFPELFSTPRLLVVSKGVVVDEVNQSKLANTYTFFKGAVDSFSKKINIYTAYTTEAITYFNNNFPDGEVITFDSQNHDESKVIYRTYFNKDITKTYLFVDYNLMN